MITESNIPCKPEQDLLLTYPIFPAQDGHYFIRCIVQVKGVKHITISFASSAAFGHVVLDSGIDADRKQEGREMGMTYN